MTTWEESIFGLGTFMISAILFYIWKTVRKYNAQAYSPVYPPK